MIKAKHFNDKFPENNNIRLETKKTINKRLKVFRNERWRLEDRDDVTFTLTHGMYDILDEVFRYFKNDEDDEDEDDLYEDSTPEERHRRLISRNIRRSQRARRIIMRAVNTWKKLEDDLEEKDKALYERLNDRLDTVLLDNELKINQLEERVRRNYIEE